MLTAEQRSEFAERGLLRLAGITDPEVVGALRERVLAFLAERKLVPESPPPGFTLTPSVAASVVNAHGFEETWGAPVLDAVDDLLGAGAWHVPKHAGQLLAMTWPQSGVTWQIPHKSWHLDYRAPGTLRTAPGVQLFLCLDAVEPRAGGTLVAAGTPRLIDAIRRRRGPSWLGRSADARAELRAEAPWFRELCALRSGEDRIARFMSQAGQHAGVSLRVEELTGVPGDVYAMHPWMVHAAALSNCGARPRMVLTERIRCTRDVTMPG